MKNFLSGVFIFCLMICANFAFAANTITVNWQTPTQRVDLTPLAQSEIGGYEIKYLKSGADVSTTQRIIISGNDKVTYDFDLPTPETYIVSMAVFDINGLYSDFVNMTYQFVNVKIKPFNFTISRKLLDVNGACQVDVNCRVVH